MNAGAAEVPAPTCTDWRGWSADEIAPLLEREAGRWARDFHWDQREPFGYVEAARASGRLPGVVAVGPRGAARGWTFFLRHADEFQIGTMVSDGAATTRALVDAALASPLADRASIVLFTPAAPDLESVLQTHGVRVEPYDYLVAQNAPDAPDARSATGLRPMESADLGPVAALLGEAYRDARFLRPFVTGGAPDDWRHYVTQLVETRGCGEFLAEASVVADDVSEPGLLSGAVIATRLHDDTGHIAQIAVGSRARGQGLARRMLECSRRALRTRGLSRVSLLVARTNTPARGLYDSAGFKPAGTFITGIR